MLLVKKILKNIYANVKPKQKSSKYGTFLQETAK